MLITMRAITLALVCLAYIGHGRRVQAQASSTAPYSTTATNLKKMEQTRATDLQRFAMLLSAFNPTGHHAGTWHPMSPHRSHRRHGHVRSYGESPLEEQMKNLPGAREAEPGGAVEIITPKKVLYSTKARKSLISGVDKVANAVKVTLGPVGRNVLIYDKHGPRIINDGVTIAANIALDTPEEVAGAKLLLQACDQTDSMAGDGTTTAAVLTQAICKAGLRTIESGANAVALQRGLLKTARFFVEKILEAAIPINTFDQYKEIATMSANNEDMGEVVAEAIMKVGANGSVTLEKGTTEEDILQIAEGLEHEVGYVSEKFVNDMESQTCILENPRVFLTDQKLKSMQDILSVLEGVVGEQGSLVVIADNIEAEALSGLIINSQKGVVKACAARAPGAGQIKENFLKDLAAFTGANVISSQLGLLPSQAKVSDLGRVAKAVFRKNTFTLVASGEQDEAVKDRVESLQLQMEELMDMPGYNIPAFLRLKQRSQKLRGAVARIYVGGRTEAEQEDKRLRYEDAINALKGACKKGMVPGGGSTFVYMLRYEDEARANLEDPEEQEAVSVLIEAMGAPVKQIAHNTGLIPDVMLEKLKDQEFGFGFNARTREYEDLIEAGVCDPASVATWGLDAAASIAGSLLTTEALVCGTEIEEEEEEYTGPTQSGIDQKAAQQLAW